MRETVYHLATTLDAIFDGVIVTDRDGLVTRLNPAAQQLTGWPMPEALGKRLGEILDLRDESTGNPARDPVIGALDTSAPVHLSQKTFLCDRHGVIRPIAGTVAPIRRPDGLVLGVVLVFRDRTQEHKSQQEILQSNQRLEMFFAQSLEGFFFMMLDEPMRWDDATDKEQALDHLFGHLKVTKVNDAVLNHYSATREQLLGMTMGTVFQHDPAYGRMIMRQILDAGRLRLEVDMRRIDGSPLQIEGDYIALRSDDGLVTGLFGAQRDINERRQAELLLLASAERFRATFEQAAVGIGHLDKEGRWLRVNERLCRIAGSTAEDFSALTLMDIIHPGDRKDAKERIDRLFNRQLQALTLEKRLLQRSGNVVWVALTLSVVRQIPGESLYAVAVVQDITERKRSEAMLRASEERFRDVVDAAGEYIWETDADWRLVFISNQVERIMGYTPAELVGRPTTDFLPEDEATRMGHFFRNRGNWAAPFSSVELQVIHRSGERIWQQISGVPVLGENGRIIGYRGASMNIHDRKMAEQKIEQLATKDALTGLPNRVLLNDRLEQAIVAASRKEQMLALMFIDLDRFKTINDSLGHHAGDLLLKAVAQRLSTCVRRGDTLARLGGDEFIVALYDLKTAEDAIIVARKMLNAVSLPYDIEGHMLSTGCSVGIGVYPSDGADVATLMRNADTAMYHAKEKGRNNYQFFSPEMNIRAVERLHLENELRLAVQNRQFTLHYQPQISLRNDQIVGAEALIRWPHPRTGQYVPPARFISVAEDTGLIVPIGEWVLQTACAQAKAWQEAGHPGMRITVNVSVGQFRGNGSLIETIDRVLKETGLQPKYLELEMTESLLFHNIEDNVQLLARLGQMGVRISIDDFGTGYSSLSYLKQLPVDTIKIDSSFVRDIVTDENDAAIIAAIIAMARRLKLRVIAEGVETLAQLNALRDLQCDEYQGFFFSKPLPAEEFAREFFAKAALSPVLGT